jgi:hypothetical protein
MIGRGVLEDGMMSSLNGVLASNSRVQELRLAKLLFRCTTPSKLSNKKFIQK